MGDLRVPSFVFSLEPRAAVEWFRAKGHRLSWNWQETWQEAHARAFTVAKVTRMDVLNDIRSAVSTALSEGKTERWFQQQLQPVLEEKGWWGQRFVVDPAGDTQRVQLGSHRRLQTIFRTNLQTSYMAGRWTDMVRNARDRPYWMYVAVMDSKTRPSHAAMHGKVYRWDDPIWQTHFPPNGFNCRCRVRALSERQVQRMGLGADSSAGKIERKKVQAGFDPRTGEIYESEVIGIKLIGRDGQPITYWTDPGWNYNPGQAAYMPELDRYSVDTASQFVEGVLTGPEFGRWYRGWERTVEDFRRQFPDLSPPELIEGLRRWITRPRGGRAAPSLDMSYPVAVLTDPMLQALDVQSRVVKLSGGTLSKQLVKRGDNLGLEDYWRVQPTLQSPAAVVREVDGNHHAFYRRDGKVFVAVIKVTRDRKEVYLQSFRRSTERELANAMADSRRLR